jgi:1-acyl-sn-glycerol-3-phosphate acyltransferase
MRYQEENKILKKSSAIFAKTVLSILVKINVFNKQVLPTKSPYAIACTRSGWIDVVYLGIILLT